MTLAPLLLLASVLASSPAPKASIPVPVVAPRPEDVGSLDGMMKAWYEIVSGPPGQPRDWGRDRSLYVPGVRFVSTAFKDGRPTARVMDHQAYVDANHEALIKKGFFETEIHRVTRRYGNIAHVWSTYESRATEKGPLIARGINSIELYWDGARWWIAGAVWFEESPEHPIPAEYLPKGR
ncbi:MAG: hypothetical protein HY823_10895 [Acidobacteria bacterium]|nr:hypothetical protein [Acidobacteriota bacterium]